MKVEGNNGDGSYFRLERADYSSHSTVKLSLSNQSTGIAMETLIGLANDATVGIDPLYDADMIAGTNGVRFYSQIDNKPFTIQGIPTNHEVVNLGFEVLGEGEDFSISLQEVQIWSDQEPVYLLDRYNNTYTDLTSAIFTFTSSIGVFNDRFELHIGHSATVLDVEPSLQRFEAKYSLDGIEILNPESIIDGNILIHNVSGQVCYEGVFANNSFIPFAFSKGQVYIIRYLSKNVTITEKISFE